MSSPRPLWRSTCHAISGTLSQRTGGLGGTGRAEAVVLRRAGRARADASSSSLLLSSLELSDTQVYEPYIRALLGTASHFCCY